MHAVIHYANDDHRVSIRHTVNRQSRNENDWKQAGRNARAEFLIVELLFVAILKTQSARRVHGAKGICAQKSRIAIFSKLTFRYLDTEPAQDHAEAGRNARIRGLLRMKSYFHNPFAILAGC